MDFDLAGARKAGYSDTELADYLGGSLNFDVPAARQAGYKDEEILQHLESLDTTGPTDYLKSAASGVLSGAGMIAQGGGEVLARGVNAVAGTELRAENPLKGAIDWLEQSKSPGAKRAEANTQITGSLFDTDTWSFGTDPSVKGLALQGLNAIGQFAPNLAIAIGTAGASIPAQLAIGATVGGLQALGGGVEEERTKFQAMSHEELLANSRLYRELLNTGVDPDVAKNSVAEAAALGGGLGNAIPSAAEGAFENFLIGALTRGRLTIPGKGVLGKAAVGLAAGAPLGGTEEAIEQIGQNIGSNLAAGGNRPVTADTLQQFVMGAIAEGAAGGGGGVATGIFKPQEQPAQPPAAKEDAKVADAITSISGAGTIEEAIAAATQATSATIFESDVAASPMGGLITGAMEWAVDRGERAAREEPAYQQLESQKSQDLNAMVGERRDVEAESAIQTSLRQEREAEQQASGQTQPQSAMSAALGKVILDRMEAMERAKGVTSDSQIGGETALPEIGTNVRELSTVDAAAHEAAPSSQNPLPEPTDAQKDAGNYQKGHLNVSGLDISIENPAGSKRRPEWVALQDHYGYIKGVPAKASDKEHVDVFIKPGTTEAFNGPVFVVDQKKKDGSFDEPKVVIGASTLDEAVTLYRRNYEAGWDGIQGITPMPMETFKQKLQDVTAFTKAQPGAQRVQKPEAFKKREQPATTEQQAPVVRIGGLLPHEMSVEQLQSAAKSAPYFDQKIAAEKELKRRDRTGETVLGRTVDQLTDKELEVVSQKGKTATLRESAVKESTALKAADQELADKLKTPAVREALPGLADSAGWAERGGHLIRQKTKVGSELAGDEKLSRTKWIPKAEWWADRPVQENEQFYRNAVQAALTGEGLTRKQKEVVKFMVRLAEDDTAGVEAAPEITPQEAADVQAVVDTAPTGHDAWSTMTEDEKNAELDQIPGLRPSEGQVASGEEVRAQTLAEEVGPRERQPGEDDEVAPSLPPKRELEGKSTATTPRPTEGTQLPTIPERRAGTDVGPLRTMGLDAGKLQPDTLYVFASTWESGERETGTINVPHGGDPLRAFKQFRSKNEQANPQIVVATDANGKPSKIISPNGKMEDFDSAKGRYIAGDVDAFRKESAAEIERGRSEGDPEKINAAVSARIDDLRKRIAETDTSIARDKKEIENEKVRQKAGLTIEKHDNRFDTWKEYFSNRQRIVEHLTDDVARMNREIASWEQQRVKDVDQRPALELAAPSKDDLKAKESQAATGNVEEQTAAVRDRDTAVLTSPEGAAPPKELQAQPTQQGGLFGTETVAATAQKREAPPPETGGGLFAQPDVVNQVGDRASRKEGSPLPNIPAAQPDPIVAAADAMIQAANAMKEAVAPKPAAEKKTPVLPASVPEGKLAEHDATMDRARDGNLQVDEFQAAYERAVENKEQITAELSKLTKDQLEKRVGQRMGQTKKDRLVSMAYTDVLQDFTLGRGVSYMLTTPNAMEDAIRKMVASTTEADLAAYADRVKEMRDERAKRIEGFKNPQTLDDFDLVSRVKGTKDLTPEQMARYDELLAKSGRARRVQQQEAKATVQAAGEKVGAKVVETKHTQKGHDLFVVQLEKRVERDDYNRLNTAAKKLGGYFSSYAKDGAVPGFQFKTREAADAFQKLATEGDTQAVQEAVVERRTDRRDEKKNSAAERLAAMADKMEEAANESMGRDRLANTAKRARQAASADADARANIAMAKTLRNLSNAIEDGTATHLDGIRTKAQVETLGQLATQAKNDRLRKQYLSSIDFERHKDRAVEVDDIAELTKSPWSFDARHEQLFHAINKLKGKPATTMLSGQLKRLAETTNDPDKWITIPRSVVEATLEKGGNTQNSYDNAAPWYWESRIATVKRLEAANIPDLPSLRAALREFVQYKGAQPKADKVKELERNLAGQGGIGIDFFPTPVDLAQRMAEALELQPGMSVLEPSAGKGNLADAVRAAEPAAEIDTVEQSATLREILEAKNYPLVGNDFMDFQPEEQYDRVIMNPPFSNGMDAEHVQRAYGMLKPGGKLVAITGEGIFFRDDAKSRAFREWFDQVGGTSEKLEGAFTDKREVKTTGVAIRMLIVDKPSEAPAFHRAPTYTTDEGGKPLLAFERVQITEPTKVGMYFPGGDAYQYTIARGDRSLGIVILLWDGNKNRYGNVRQLLYIKTHTNLRGQGIAEEVVRGILSHNDGIPLTAVSVLPKARGFWEKMGAEFINDEDGDENGILTLENYRNAKAARDDARPGGRGPGAGEGQAPVGEGPEGPGDAGSEGGGQALAFRGPAQGRGLGTDAVRKVVAPLIRNWGNAPDIVVHDSIDAPSVPQAIRAENEKRATAGATGGVDATILHGRVHLFADQLSSPWAVQRAIFHEALGHYGLRGTFGEALDPILDDVAKSLKGRVEAKARDYGLDVNDIEQRRTAAEEVLAELAQSMPRSSFVQRLIAAIRQFLRDLGVSIDLSEVDIISNFIEPARAFVEGQQAETTGQAVPAFGRDQTASEAFQRWFGDSKVVDENGQPRVVYHGTAKGDFDKFKTSTSGLLGRGIYFTSDSTDAEDYANHTPEDGASSIYPVYLKIENPFNAGYNGTWSDVYEKLTGRQPRNWENEMPNAQQMLDLKINLVNNGYDGLIVDYTDSVGSAGPVTHYVVLEQDQVKSAIGNRGTFDAQNPDIRFNRQGTDVGRRDFLGRSMALMISSIAPSVKAVTPTLVVTDNGTAKEPVAWIAENSENRVYRELAKRILPLVEDVRVRIITPGTYYVDPFPGSLKYSHGATVLSAQHKDSRRIFLRSDTGLTETTILHEGIHAGTMGFIRAHPKNAAVARLEELRQEVSRALASHPDEGFERNIIRAATSNIDEFVAWGLTHPVFQKILRDVKVENKGTAWKSFIDIISRILGIVDANANTRSALEDLFDASFQLIEEAKNDSGWLSAVDQDVELAQAEDNAVPPPAFHRAAWIDQQPMDTQEALRKAGVWFTPPTLKARVKDWSTDWQKRLKQGVVDQFDPIKEYDYHAYILARMTRGADNALDGLLNYGTVYLDQDGAVDVNFEKGGFLGIMSKLGGEHDRFLAWVIGNRAERLLAEGREHNFTAQDVKRLKDLSHGTMLDGTSRSQEYARVRAELDRYNKAVLDIAERAGLIDGADRAVWENDFYVPFYRLMEDADQIKGPMPSKGLVNQYAFKVLKGGEQALGDPMENILKNWSHLLDASLKNQAAKESILAAQRVGAVVEGEEATVRQMSKASGLKDAVVSFTDRGTQRWFMVEDPFLLDAIKGIGFTGFQGVGMKVMQKFKKWLTMGVTVSPTFRIRNVIRDSLQMIGANPASYNVLDNVLTGWKSTKSNTPEYASIMAGGGVMRFGTILDGDRAEHVKRLIASGVDDQTILTTPERVKDAMQQAWDWWQRVGDRAENVNRAALYKKLRADGKTHLEASFAARDTMDFSMQGTWAAIRFLSQTVPFFNARLQGLYKLGRGAAEDPRRFGIVVGGATLASLALFLAYRDDDDWKRREDWDRETFWWFKIGDKAFRIPKPFEIGAIATIAERGLEAMVSDDLTGKQFAHRVFSIVSQQLSMNPVPQLAMPLIELYANRDSFTDRPIEGIGMERVSKERRSGPQTSATAQLLGKNGFVSPVQIDHLVSGYFGWLGSHIVSTADLALRPAMDLPGKPAWRVDEMLVVGDFVKDMPAYQSKYVTRLYEQMKEVQQAMADLKELQKVGATEEAKKLLEDRGDKIRLYRLYTRAETQLQNVNRQIKMVQYRSGDAESKRERLDMLYATRNRIAQLTEERARASLQ